uniref:Anaphase-promoting complex subunit 10 n=1 Tax=Pristionchus pacificus TaxID=54126 RepID=A0A2A6CA42_PRIPA|eukprot:PDM74960.1 hypothetical protein PRIPAC_40341 [Pristionchus pacificus]
MATVRMQFDHEEDDDELSGRDANNRGSDWIHALEAGSFITKHEKDEYRDISSRANWTLSSCKVDGDGFGINELLSDSVDSYWQSDGPQPHTITVEFTRKTDISFLALYLDYKSDESYTPNKLLVRLGSSVMHLDDEFEQSFTEPVGWQIMDLRRGSYAKRAFVLQLQVVQNHQNGRDTHIRHMRVIGPSRSRFDSVARALVTPLIDPFEFDADENGDPTNMNRPPMDVPIMPVLTNKLKSMKMIRSECGSDPTTSCSHVALFNKNESLVACKAVIGVWIANGFPVDESIEGSNGRRHVLLEMRSGKEISLVTLESKIDAGEVKKSDQAITSFSIDSSATRLIDRPLPTLISNPSSISVPSSNNQVSLFAEELARQKQQKQTGSVGVLGYNWRLGADQQWKLAPVTEEDAQAAAVVRNQPIIQPNPMNPMVPMPSMGPMGLPQSPMVPPQSPIGPLPMSVGRPMASTNGMGEMMHPPEPSFPSIVWRRFNQVLDGFSNGFSSMADKVFKII